MNILPIKLGELKEKNRLRQFLAIIDSPSIKIIREIVSIATHQIETSLEKDIKEKT